VSSFTEEQALVAEANAAFYRAFETLDLERMKALWLHSDEIRCVHPSSEPLAGWDQVMAGWALVLANTPPMRFDLQDVAVVVNGGIGWVSCVECMLENQQLVGSTIATNLFQQNVDGRWMMIHHHASPFSRRII
jgi:ketosteroid isomerase-like protein